MALPTLETPRLFLRPFELWDALEVQRLAGDFRIADTTLRIPHPYEDGMAEAWIAQRALDPGDELVFAIVRKQDAALVGAIGLILRGEEAELGYWIGVPYWNQGYASEAGAEILRHAFSKLRLNRVYANHFERNPASGRVLRKLGMQPDPTGPTQVEKDGRIEKVVPYAISAWLSSPNLIKN
ncbi:MAG TPA: GNAT family N-acetyltransferase [bacterium]|nr:GNAT family N-acetyltransferase [bacterium]